MAENGTGCPDLSDDPSARLVGAVVGKSRSKRRSYSGVTPLAEYAALVPKRSNPHHFDEVALLVGREFCLRLVAAWPVAFAAEVHTYTDKRHAALIGFFRYLRREAAENPNGPQAELISGFRSDAITPVSFANSTAAYCALLQDTKDRSVVASDNKRTRNNIINVLGATFKELARRKLLPIDHGMTAIPTGPYEPRVLTLAEVSAEDDLGPLDARATFSRLIRIPELAKRLGIEHGRPEVLSAQELSTAMVKVIQIRCKHPAKPAGVPQTAPSSSHTCPGAGWGPLPGVTGSNSTSYVSSNFWRDFLTAASASAGVG